MSGRDHRCVDPVEADRLGPAGFARWALSGFVAASLTIACGGAAPRDADIFHDPALRPGRVDAASDAERQLLTRLDEAPSDEPITVAGHTFVAGAPYDAASGRRCRSVSADGDARLACAGDDGWGYVPEIVRRLPHVEGAP